MGWAGASAKYALKLTTIKVLFLINQQKYAAQLL